VQKLCIIHTAYKGNVFPADEEVFCDFIILKSSMIKIRR